MTVLEAKILRKLSSLIALRTLLPEDKQKEDAEILRFAQDDGVRFTQDDDVLGDGEGNRSLVEEAWNCLDFHRRIGASSDR